ncbi:hypothetical protein [uncultured Mucilaginibacter sp.]|uniref:hypothetical protein n=1 Tax=uncultured Mucilaginibacter sp. TaxID=797541 RepID=UPI002623E64B|nr:hypothetical protein [uncultured Mucilaginibacter sp.]
MKKNQKIKTNPILSGVLSGLSAPKRRPIALECPGVILQFDKDIFTNASFIGIN